MALLTHISRTLLLLSSVSVAVSAQDGQLISTQPSVTLDNATVVGVANETTGTNQFLGIPFAQPPVGDLRLRLPQPVAPYSGTINATAFGNQCIQQTQPNTTLPSGLPSAAAQFLSGMGAAQPQTVPQDEDCLNVNVIVPANVTAESKLPVAVWIYGGGFALGSNIGEPGENVVQRSVELGHPIIFVSPNYRLNAFGFLGGKEMKEANVTNLGLHDQREAFRWVQKYISAFGGDPSKVMIWGESAGAQSVGMQMVYNNGDSEGLFRAAFMESGAPMSTGYVDNPFLQATFDQFVVDAGCSGSADAVACLRNISTDAFTQAVNKAPTLSSYRSVNQPWEPRADGNAIAQPPEHLLLAGKIANVPFVSGNDMDEGTLFSFANINVTTDDEFFDYVSSNFFPNIPSANITRLLELYPSDPAAGSPFGTGDNFTYTPEYKRMAALQGDLLFIAPRRLLTQTLAGKQAVYSFLGNEHGVEGLGTPHGSDLQDVFGAPGTGNLQDYLIRFAATLNPNGDGAVEWPQYTNQAPNLLTLNNGEPAVNITKDNFRAEAMAYLTGLCVADPM
ncbi:hypothetical protein GSI_03704 [Ganoderma sinense ZZ0214-1]|uniref:Carboxylic ester hydrolase n=1 Tax=Ganoderma sinense ZZ0214-1 TaxID=1077348 RepID=A0A2G8SJP9_9APHY|nr:hypothetical protein GSI_03704 [Ganoderma sinense ZZ0214-1]